MRVRAGVAVGAGGEGVRAGVAVGGAGERDVGAVAGVAPRAGAGERDGVGVRVGVTLFPESSTLGFGGSGGPSPSSVCAGGVL